jgi:hypothetical protein
VIARLVAGRGPIEGEDVLLAAWNLVAFPIGALFAGSAGSAMAEPLVGLFEVAAVIGAVVALATRPPGPAAAPSEFRTWILSGPLIGALGLVGENGARRLGVPGTDVVLAIAVIVGLGAIVLSDRLPVLDTAVRRLLVLPLILGATAFFGDLAADLVDGLEPGALLTALLSGAPGAPQEVAVAGFVTVLVLGGAAVFFAMLVVAPRELADPEPRPAVWLLRFVLFFASAATGIGLWTLI